jgi:hypothetical protein
LKTLADFDILIDVSRNDGSGVSETSSGLSRCSEFSLKQKKNTENYERKVREIKRRTLNIFFKEFPTENPEALALYFLFILVKSTYSVSCADSKLSISQFINVGAIKSLIFGCKQVFRENVLIRGKTVNPGKIGLDELYNLDSVFEIVRQMKYCRAVPEVVKLLSKLTDSIIIGYFTSDIVNGSKVLLEIILNSNKSWKVLIRGKTVNPEKIGFAVKTSI